MKKSTVLIFLVLLVIGCENRKLTDSRVFLSNVSLGKFEKAFISVKTEDLILINDTIINDYLSYGWDDKVISIPNESLRLKVKVSGDDFEVQKDTILAYEDSIFIRFNLYHINEDIITLNYSSI